MRKERRPSYLLLLIIVAIVVSVAITCLIVWRLVSKKTENNNPYATEMQNITLENAFILSNSDKEITFLYQNENYTMNGKMDAEYKGVADIQIENGKITKIFSKPDTIKGVLESYTEEQMEIQDYGFLEKEVTLPVYVCKEDDVSQGTLQDLIVGSSKVKYVLANNVIEAILVDENTIAENIRVVIKHESEIVYPELFVRSNDSFQISAENSLEEIAANQIVDVKQYMDSHQLSRMKLLSSTSGMNVCDSDGTIIGLEYPDTIFCLREESGIVLVNELPIEEYVKRVLPSEMPQKFGAEALKAQAVCARTYAYSQMRNATYAMYGGNIDNTTAFQAYNTVSRTDKTDKAVEDTSGQVVSQNGNLITCYYYSTNPGTTEDMELWKKEDTSDDTVAAFAYLQKKHETDIDPGDLSSEKTIAEFLSQSPEAFDKVSPFYRWSAKLNLAEISDSEFGRAKSIQVTKRSSSGYILSLEIQCEKGKRILEDENDIRSYLGKGLEQIKLSDGTTRDNLTMIPSACFCITRNDGMEYELNGGGFGHGIGMSQYGASAMAEQGKTFDQIINFYYKDVIITDMNNIAF